MDTYVETLEEPDLESPVLIEGLPGIGNIGRIAVGYLVDQLGATKFAEIYSPHFMPFVLLKESTAHLLKNELYYWENPDGDDLVFLVGDAQSGDPGSSGHYEIADAILEYADGIGVERLFTLGGFPTGEIEETEGIEVLGAVNSEDLIEKYDRDGVSFENTGGRIGMIVGATGLLLGLGKQRDMEGVCLLGETTGFPILTDPRAAEKVLEVLTDMLDIEVDLDELEERSEEMEQFLKRIESMQQKALKQMASEEGGELSYIG